jgi:hypothetical protein
MKRLICSLAALLLAAPITTAQRPSFTVSITAGKDDLKNAIVVVPVPEALFATGAKLYSQVTTADRKHLLAQMAPPRLLDDPKQKLEVSVLVPELKAGQKLELNVDLIPGTDSKPNFAWAKVDGLEQLTYEGRPVIRYFHKPFDSSLAPMVKGKADPLANPSLKPYHQLFTPDGSTIITNDNKGMYPHHRGIFYGFNTITYDGKKADVWHGRNGEHTDHEKILSAEAGTLFGRHTLQIS